MVVIKYLEECWGEYGSCKQPAGDGNQRNHVCSSNAENMVFELGILNEHSHYFVEPFSLRAVPTSAMLIEILDSSICK